jgi:hypothetical protein
MHPTARVEEIVKKLVTVLFVLVVFACRNQEAASPVESASQAMQNDVAKDSGVALASSGASPAQAARETRMIVRTANVSILVRDTSSAVDAVTKQAEAVGGYVADSRIWREGELLRATLTIRVPQEKLTATLTSIRGVAKRVENETIASMDVSQEFVDLGSQLRNLEATEVELRQLLTTIRERTRKAAEVLEIHQQLTNIRAQIEQIRGRMRYVGQVSAMSTVTLNVIPDAIAQPVVQPGWRAVIVAKDAGRALVSALQGMATLGIWLLIYFLPIVAALGFAVFLLWKLTRGISSSWRTRKSLPS